MKALQFTALLSFILITVACSSDNAIQPLEYEEQLNESYGTDPDQVFDLYLPENRTLATKVLLLVHGGGWNAGDKQDLAGFRDYVLEQLPDVAVVNMNYRLADENNFCLHGFRL